MTTQAEFFEKHAIDGELTEAQMLQMLDLPEGDTVFTLPGEDSSASPTAAAQTAEPVAEAPKPDDAPKTDPAPADPAAATPASEPETPPVILAKDGKHTIPYERLEEARLAKKAAEEAAAAAKAEAERLAAELAAAKAAPAQAPAAAPTPDAAAVREGLFGDYSDEQMAAGVAQLVEQRVAPLLQKIATLEGQLTPLQQQQQVSATEAHWSAIYGKHPDADSLIESAELANYIKAQPTFVQAAMNRVLDEGTAAEVVELFDGFKKTTQPAPASTAAPAAADAAAAAQAAIANAKSVPPTSLSEIPAGASAHHDEAQAMLEANPLALMNKFEGKTPEQIAALLDRVL